MFLKSRNKWYSQSQNKPKGDIPQLGFFTRLNIPLFSRGLIESWHWKWVPPFSFEFNSSKIAWISSDRNHRTIKMANAEIISCFFWPVSWGIKQCIQQDYYCFWRDLLESLAPDTTVIWTSSTNFVADYIHATLLNTDIEKLQYTSIWSGATGRFGWCCLLFFHVIGTWTVVLWNTAMAICYNIDEQSHTKDDEMTFSETLPIIWHASCLWELLPARTVMGKIRSQDKHAKLVNFIRRQEVTQDCRANLAETLPQNLDGEDTEVHPRRFDGRYESVVLYECACWPKDW